VRLTRSDLMALFRKYQVLSDLRRSQDLDPATLFDVRGTLQRLAREFPGALRELDILPLEEIDQRADALHAAADSGEIEPWMEWMHEYHVTLRAALWVRLQLSERARRGAVDERELRHVAETLRKEIGEFYDAEFVLGALHPPQGRINALVFQRLEMTFGTPFALINRTLFPERRPGRL
jgi:hypothetical protein